MTPEPVAPLVSILVPARNEASTIWDCLAHLAALNYPKESLEILIGDDCSEDETSEKIHEFISQNPNTATFIKPISITEHQKKIAGKAGVLALLIQEAQGDFLLMTDADTKVSRNWVRGMIRNFDSKTGIISGFTLIQKAGFFANVQAWDWVMGLGVLQVFSQWNIPITGVGSNMAIRKTAYQATGGYENFPPSVTEDFALFQEIIQHNFEFKHLTTKDVLVLAQAEETVMDLLRQRQRWSSGVMKVPIPFYWFIIYFVYLFLGVILVSLAWFNWQFALSVWILKILCQYAFAAVFIQHFKQSWLWKYAIFYEFYQFIFYPIITLFWLFSPKISWKGKDYSK